MVRKILPVILVLFSCHLTIAQLEVKDAVMKTVKKALISLADNDSSAFRKSFIEQPNLAVVYENDQGETVIVKTDFKKFLSTIGSPKDQNWSEPIWNPQIQIQNNLAAVWVDYSFYLGDELSHCGINSFQLVRLDERWQIANLTYTMRRSGCESPADVMEDY